MVLGFIKLHLTPIRLLAPLFVTFQPDKYYYHIKRESSSLRPSLTCRPSLYSLVLLGSGITLYPQ